MSTTEFGTSARVYLDYHASTPVDPAVVDAMLPWWQQLTGNPHSEEHSYGWAAREAVDLAKSQIAGLIGVDGDDIIFTSGATEANNLALLGLMRFAERRRQKLLVSAIEHASILGPAFELKKEGIQCDVIPVESDGSLNREMFLEMLDESVHLVSVGAVNGEIGTIQDLKWIADRCHEVGALLHSDCAQALTAVPKLLGDSGTDLASVSAHKAYGPQGVGALYVAPGVTSRMVPITYGGGQQFGLRPGTLPAALCVGFGTACERLRSYGASEQVRISGLRDNFLAKVTRLLPHVINNGPPALRHPGNISLQLPGLDARDVIQRLQPSIAISTGSACHSGSHEPSHVLTAIGLTSDQAFACIRVGIGRFSTLAELELAAVAIANAALSVSALKDAPQTSS